MQKITFSNLSSPVGEAITVEVDASCLQVIELASEAGKASAQEFKKLFSVVQDA